MGSSKAWVHLAVSVMSIAAIACVPKHATISRDVPARPIARAPVQLWYQGGGVGGNTDSSGTIRFDNRPAGLGSLRVRRVAAQARLWMCIVTLRDAFRDTLILDDSAAAGLRALGRACGCREYCKDVDAQGSIHMIRADSTQR